MNIGGQAVIEGVMYRGPKHVAVAVRDPNGEIVTKVERFVSLSEKYSFFKLPFVRGVVSMFEMLKLGIAELMYSGNVSEEEEMSGAAAYAVVAVSMVAALGIFLALPYFLTLYAGLNEDSAPLLFNLVVSLIKVAILVVYISAISLMPDVRTMFQYHGAEHKVINAYEDSKKPTVAVAGRYTTAHYRCGTSFIFLVLLSMVVLFSVIPSIVSYIWPGLEGGLRRVVLLSFRFLLLVPVVGVSYELLKISAKHKDNLFFRILAYPGLLIQKLTTREPTGRQLEVALASFNALVLREKNISGIPGKQ